MKMKIAIDKLFRVYILVTVLNIVFFTFFYFTFPELRKIIFYEDYLVENLTALFFLISFVFGIFSIIHIGEGLRRLYLILPLIGLFGFLEEMSYGYRIFHYEVPVMYSENFDALHDLMSIGYSFLMIHARYMLYVFPVVICTVILLLCIKYWRKLANISSLLESYSPFGFLFVTVGFIFVAQIIDLRLLMPDCRTLIEEVLEMNAALTLLFAIIAIGTYQTDSKNIEQSKSTQHKKVSAYFSMMFGILVISGVVTFVISSITTAKLMEQNDIFLKKNISKIFTSWDSEMLINEMVPELVSSQIQRQNIATSFTVMQKKLGRLETFTTLETEPMEMNKELEYFKHEENNVFIWNMIDAHFEKNNVQLEILTIKRENQWMLLGIKLL